MHKTPMRLDVLIAACSLAIAGCGTGTVVLPNAPDVVVIDADADFTEGNATNDGTSDDVLYDMLEETTAADVDDAWQDTLLEDIPDADDTPDAGADHGDEVTLPWPTNTEGWSRHATNLLDDQARAVFLHGANVSNFAKYQPDFLTWHTLEDFQALAAIGIDSVRLQTYWAAIMPTDGVIDTVYLDAYAAKVEAAIAAGLLVVVDMHQDVFGVGFLEDGAPRWACAEENYATWEQQSPWYMNYLTPQVQACYDAFYTDPVLFGKFVDAWVAVATRVKDLPEVIGFDLFNEPNWGTYTPSLFLPELFLPLQEQIADALFEVAPDKVVFLQGTTLFHALGVPEPARPTRLTNAIYGAHYYHPAVHDGSAYVPATMTADCVAALDSMEATATVLGDVPVWVGEYGGPWSVAEFATYMGDMLSTMTAKGFGRAIYSDDMAQVEGFGLRLADRQFRPEAVWMLSHPRARRVPGPVIEQTLTRELTEYHLRFRWDADSPLDLWCPRPEGATDTWAPVVVAVEDSGRTVTCHHPEGTPNGRWDCDRPMGPAADFQVTCQRAAFP